MPEKGSKLFIAKLFTNVFFVQTLGTFNITESFEFLPSVVKAESILTFKNP